DPAQRDKSGLTARDWAARYNAPAVLGELGMEPQAVELVTAAADGTTMPTARQATATAIALLQRTGASFFREGGCAACHAQNISAMAVAVAKSAKIPVEETARVEEVKAALSQLGAAEQPLLQRADPPTSEILSFALLQFSADGWEADRTTDAMIYNLAA